MEWALAIRCVRKRVVVGRLTGVALVTEAIWIAGATLVVVPYIRGMSEFEGSSLPLAEQVVGYGLGLTIAAVLATTGLHLLGMIRIARRVGPWFILAAVLINACIAIAAGVSALITTGTRLEPALAAALTGGAATLSLRAWVAGLGSRT